MLINPEVVEATGEWVYEEGCLSIPGFHFEIVRPKVVTMTGLDLDGNEVVIEGDELLGRVFLHELDHLDGVLMLDRLDPDERKRRRAARAARRRACARRRARAARRRPSACEHSCARLLGTPEAAVVPFGRCSRPATTSRSSSPNPTAGAARRRDDPEPGEAPRPRTRARRSRRRSGRVRRSTRSARPAPSAASSSRSASSSRPRCSTRSRRAS